MRSMELWLGGRVSLNINMQVESKIQKDEDET